jgi:opacity protein-like surface antigen
MKKMFLTMALAFATMFASAQFMVVTTIDQPEGDAKWEMSNITDNMGIGYMFNDKMTIGVVKSGEEYDLWGRYQMKWVYLAMQMPTEEMTENMTFGVGYSLSVWNNLYVEPSYMMSMKEDSEGKFKIGLSYKF